MGQCETDLSVYLPRVELAGPKGWQLLQERTARLWGW